MQDFRKWRKATPSVANLLLDTQNPRIPRGRGLHEQRDLIAELVKHDRVLDLAKSIASDGYYPLEYLIAIETDSKPLVIEGNRRLAALKLLINPDLAPDDEIKNFKKLSNKVALDTIDKVSVIFAPSREAAAPLIMQKHTRRQIESWSVLMQAGFYRSLAESGQTLAELSEQYGRTQGEIADAIRTDTMYAIACSMDLPANISANVRDPRVFNASVLERLIKVPKFREFMGIEFKDQTTFQGSLDEKEFKKAFAKILTDIVNEDVDTRKLNKVSDVEEYLATIASVKPKKPAATKLSAETFDINVPDLSSGGPAKATAKKKTAVRKPTTMIPPGTRCELTDQRINDIFSELRKLRPDTFPNACAVLLRVLLELSVGDYLEANNKIKPLLETAKKKGKPADWYPPLRQLLAEILKDQTISSNMKTLARKRLNQLMQRTNNLLSLDDLDGYVHNNYIHPSPKDLFALWGTLEGLFEIVLKAPAKPTK